MKGALKYLALGLLLTAGCMGAKEQSVSGFVSWEGTPIEEGQVVLIPTEGSGQPTSAKIESGSFSLKAMPGTYKVQVFASRPRGNVKDQSMGMVPRESYIPEQYNAKTKLQREVTRGSNSFTLDLPEK